MGYCEAAFLLYGIVGMRKASSVEDTVKCLDIRLRAEDIKCMEEAVKTIQVAVLDK